MKPKERKTCGGVHGIPDSCPICGKTCSHYWSTGTSIADGRIYICIHCRGYFLFPPKVVVYDNSGWSSKREAQAEADRMLGERYARAICNWFSSQQGQCLKTVLEIGCGTGFMQPGFTKAGVQYTGIDIDSKSIDFARDSGIDAHLIPAEQLSSREVGKRKYDLVISSNTFEHVANPMEAFRNLSLLDFRAAIIIVPNPEGLLPRLKAFIFVRRMVSHYLKVKREVAYTIDGYWHNIAYSKSTLRYFCKMYNLHIDLLKTLSINDPVFGFVQPNRTFSYRLLSALISSIDLQSQLILIVNKKMNRQSC